MAMPSVAMPFLGPPLASLGHSLQALHTRPLTRRTILLVLEGPLQSLRSSVSHQQDVTTWSKSGAIVKRRESGLKRSVWKDTAIGLGTLHGHQILDCRGAMLRLLHRYVCFLISGVVQEPYFCGFRIKQSSSGRKIHPQDHGSKLSSIHPRPPFQQQMQSRVHLLPNRASSRMLFGVYHGVLLVTSSP